MLKKVNPASVLGNPQTAQVVGGEAEAEAETRRRERKMCRCQIHLWAIPRGQSVIPPPMPKRQSVKRPIQIFSLIETSEWKIRKGGQDLPLFKLSHFINLLLGTTSVDFKACRSRTTRWI